MYALVEILGRQYKVDKGKTLRIGFLGEDKADGVTLEFSSVLLLSCDGKVSVGKPYVSGAKVKASLIHHNLGRKVISYRYKRRKDYERKVGHRQDYSMIKVEDILDA